MEQGPIPDQAETRRFRTLGPVRPHFWKVQRMAQAAGVDLVAAMRDGQLSVPDWAAMIHRCRGCEWSDGCSRWLSQSKDDPRPVPHLCENQARFVALQTQGTRSE